MTPFVGSLSGVSASPSVETSFCWGVETGGLMYCSSGSIITSGTVTTSVGSCASPGTQKCTIAIPSPCTGFLSCRVGFSGGSFWFQLASGEGAGGGGFDPAAGVVKQYHSKIVCCSATAASRYTCGTGADGTGSSALFNRPAGIAISPSGTFALVADKGFFRIRKISLNSQSVTTLAYDSGSELRGIAIDKDSTFALVVDETNRLIRKISLSTEQGVVFAGGGSTLDGGFGT